MDTLENKNISGKRVKIIDEDNDAIWGTVETIDYVKGKIGLMADGQNGRLEFYFKCDIKKIFVIDDSGGAAATKDDRRAFESAINDRRAFETNVGDRKSINDRKAVGSSFGDRKSVGSSFGDRKSVGSSCGDRKGVDSSSNDIDETFYSISSNTGSSIRESGKRDSVDQVFPEERCERLVSKEAPERKGGESELDKEFEISDKHLRKSEQSEITNHIKVSSKCDKKTNNFGKDDISIQMKNKAAENESCDLSNGLKSVNIGSESGTSSNSRYIKDGKQPDRLFKRGIKTENEHLRNLHPVDMNKLLDREKIEKTGELESYVDEAEFTFLMLPSVSSRASLGQDVNGQVANPSKQQKVIRDLLWKSPTKPPVFHPPTRLYIIQNFDDIYEESVERIRLEPVIGVSLEGELLGRVGRLCFLLIATPKDVFMFDILQLGKDGLMCGLKAVLQDETIVKVFHDARQPSDILFHQYDVTLANVFDTLAADIVFQLNWSVHRGFIQQYARALNHLAKEYLGVHDEDLFFPKYRRSRLKEDTAIWRQRPLPNHLVLGAVRRSIYLLPLRDICSSAVKLPFRRGVSALLSCVRDVDDPHAAAMVHQTALLPSQVRNVLVTGDVVASKAEC